MCIRDSLANVIILQNEFAIVLLRSKPLGFPVLGNAKPEPIRMYFLAHLSLLFLSYADIDPGEGLADDIRTTHASRGDSLDSTLPVDENLGHIQLSLIHISEPTRLG